MEWDKACGATDDSILSFFITRNAGATSALRPPEQFFWFRHPEKYTWSIHPKEDNHPSPYPQ